MDELLKSVKPNKKETIIIAIKGIFELAVYAVIFGVFLGAMLFGDSSISTYTDLENRINIIQKQIDTLNKTNAKLQKDYFELLSIQGDYDN